MRNAFPVVILTQLFTAHNKTRSFFKTLSYLRRHDMVQVRHELFVVIIIHPIHFASFSAGAFSAEASFHCRRRPSTDRFIIIMPQTKDGFGAESKPRREPDPRAGPRSGDKTLLHSIVGVINNHRRSETFFHRDIF